MSESTTESVPANGAAAIRALTENEVLLVNGHIYRIEEVDAGPSTTPTATLWNDQWESHDLIVLPDGSLGIDPNWTEVCLDDTERVESFAQLQPAGDAMLRSTAPDDDTLVAETLIDVDVPLRPPKSAVLHNEWGVLKEETPPIGTTGATYIGPDSSVVTVERHRNRFQVRAGRRDDHPPMYSYCSRHHRLVDALQDASDVIETAFPDLIPLRNPVPELTDDAEPADVPELNGWSFCGKSDGLELWTWTNTERDPRLQEVIELSRIHSGDATNNWRVQLAGTGQRQRETLAEALRVVALEMAQCPAPTGGQAGHLTSDRSCVELWNSRDRR